MRAVLLSAGQGRRLLPLTAETPKCALQVQERSLLEWQIQELAKCGVRDVTVIVGFRADKVDQILSGYEGPVRFQTVFNPFYGVSDNLASCWVARESLKGDFLLINGDTLFESAILQTLLDTPTWPVTLLTDRKDHYDADDMKVCLDGQRLVQIGKTIPPDQAHGESIGMMAFRGEGASLFREALDQKIRQPEALKMWYLSIIDELAQQGKVSTVSIKGARWAEIDCHEDLLEAKKLVEYLAGAPVQFV
ncbi:MAG: phosphocholine cytidylyltransferase family protein [Nitrospirae bacterium]|nr:phosphocholine cytidylyltransferase family protein [Nitrospirota bacterium]